MRSWSYRWLPIIFGCHCRDDRSFHFRGRKFPICARCTGELFGMMGCLLSALFYLPSVPTTLVLMIPMLLDGFSQSLTAYESTNFRRLLTGLLFGYALMALFLVSSAAAFRFGYHLTN